MIEDLCGYPQWRKKRRAIITNETLARSAYRAGVLAGIRYDLAHDLQRILDWLYEEMDKSEE